ncbi:MAG: hypothetical protein AMXMBFR51_29860 [Ignavibacteriota bacterium]
MEKIINTNKIRKKNVKHILTVNDAYEHILGIVELKTMHFVCLFLGKRNLLLGSTVFSDKTNLKSPISPQKIFNQAASLNAQGIIISSTVLNNKDNNNFYELSKLKRYSSEESKSGIKIIDYIQFTSEGIQSLFQYYHNQYSDYVSENFQESLFSFLTSDETPYHFSAQKIQETYIHIPRIKEGAFQLHNRRYIGNKYKLIEWIFSIIDKECKGHAFADIFAGTGIVGAIASKHFSSVIINDFLYSNYCTYKAFLGSGKWNANTIDLYINRYNSLSDKRLKENYFSSYFSNKYFSYNSALKIGYIRDDIENNKGILTEKEYFILITSLMYSADKIANTVGHYDAYFKKNLVIDNFIIRPIDPIKSDNINIFREDANILAKTIDADIVYIDPPYNSRQYSRFYHLLETLVKWDKPKLFGVALKPSPENMSDYCRTSAKTRFYELVMDISAKYLVVSYNNTYESKSNSSQNKITLEEIVAILKNKGETKVFEKPYRHFNAGSTDFSDHKEYLFVTHVK